MHAYTSTAVIVRLRVGVVLPGRLRRVDSFSMYVGKCLGDSAVRVGRTQQRAANLRHEIQALKVCMWTYDALT